MAAIRQILVDWITINGGGKVSVFYFDAGIGSASQRLALNTFLTACMGACDNTTRYTIRTEGIDVNDIDGALLNAWSAGVVHTDNGDQAVEPVNDATQALVRWHTATVVDRRFVQGRTFLPGIDRGQILDGNLGASAVTAIANAANALATGTAGLRVWSRPRKAQPPSDQHPDGVTARPGLAVPTTSGSCWNELAVLRRRRG